MKYICLILLIASCASRPQLYPNQKFKSSGKEIAKKDIDSCMVQAEEYLKSSKGKQVAKSAGAGAAIGAAIGKPWAECLREIWGAVLFAEVRWELQVEQLLELFPQTN